MTNATGSSHLSTAGLLLSAAGAASASCSVLPQVEPATQLATPASDMTTAGWSDLVSITRQHPVSTPVLTSRTIEGFRVVYGFMDRPIESSIPSFRIAIGRWRCE